MEHIEAEMSGSDESDGMMFADSKKPNQQIKNTLKTNNKAPEGVQYERGKTMYINGKPILINKNN